MRERQTSERTCIVTRAVLPPGALIRFVRAPDGGVAPDIRSRLPGRGVYVTASADLVAQAAKRQIFSRGFKAKAEASPTLAGEVDQLLEADCLQTLALANKAGLVTAGFAKVAAALEAGRVRALVEAVDGGPDGRRKLEQSGRRGGGSVPRRVELFTSSQLDLALGRTNVIHAALAGGGLTEAFLARCGRLVLYRGESAATFVEEEAERPRASARSVGVEAQFLPTGREDGSGSGTE
ncbi:MAG: RNA-binding protein [Methylocystis sp.]